MPMIRYNVLVDEDTLKVIKEAAKQRQTSVSALIRLAMIKLADALTKAPTQS